MSGAAAAPVAPIRHLGRLRLVAIGINSVVGGGIFVLPAIVAARLGTASIAAYLLAGLVVIGVGLSLGRLAARYERSGGPYEYVRQAFGDFWGFQAGWLFCLARLTAMASLLNAFARYVGELLPQGRGLPVRAGLVAIAAAFVIATNIAGIRQTSAATNLLAAVKILPLLLLGGAGLFFVRPGAFPWEGFAPADMMRAVLLLIFAFSGFEILTVPAEESLRPRRDMPVALIATVLCVCGIYLLVHVAMLGMLDDLARRTAPLASAAALIAGTAGGWFMTAAAAISTAGCSLASLVGGSRTLYAMAATRQVPAWTGTLHPALRTPVAGTLLLGLPGAALAVWGRYEWLSAISAGTRLLVYLACCLACLRPVAATAVAGTGAGGRGIAALTAVAVVALLMALEPTEVVAGMIGLGIGMVLYLAARRARAAAEGGAAR